MEAASDRAIGGAGRGRDMRKTILQQTLLYERDRSIIDIVDGDGLEKVGKELDREGHNESRDDDTQRGGQGGIATGNRGGNEAKGRRELPDGGELAGRSVEVT